MVRFIQSTSAVACLCGVHPLMAAVYLSFTLTSHNSYYRKRPHVSMVFLSGDFNFKPWIDKSEEFAFLRILKINLLKGTVNLSHL